MTSTCGGVVRVSAPPQVSCRENTLKIQSVKYPEMLLVTSAGRVHFQAGQAEVEGKALEAEVRSLAASDEDLGLIVPTTPTGRKRRNHE